MIQKIATSSAINGLRLKMTKLLTLCSNCIFDKAHHTSFSKNINKIKATHIRMLNLYNIYGPMSIFFHGRSLYYIYFLG